MIANHGKFKDNLGFSWAFFFGKFLEINLGIFEIDLGNVGKFSRYLKSVSGNFMIF